MSEQRREEMDLSQPPAPHGRKSGAWQKSERHDGEQITATITLYEEQWQAILRGAERAGLPVDTQRSLAALAAAHEWETS